jgi:hypothetical protein
MILEIGKYGIRHMCSTIDSAYYKDMIIIYRGMGCVPMMNQISCTIWLGEQISIFCDTIQDTKKLFELINEVVSGTRQEKLERILNKEE